MARNAERYGARSTFEWAGNEKYRNRQPDRNPGQLQRHWVKSDMVFAWLMITYLDSSSGTVARLIRRLANAQARPLRLPDCHTMPRILYKVTSKPNLGGSYVRTGW